MKRLLPMIVFAMFCMSAKGQSLPDEMYFSADGKILYAGGQAPTGFYDRATIKDVYLNFTQTNYWTLLQNNYTSETEIPATLIYDGITYPEVGVRFRGNTSYQQTGTSQKKSFAVSTDFVNVDQDIEGYKNFKFNNAHQDPTFMREVLYNRMARRHTPIAKANYIHLYLNNQDWGIYPNVQSVDKSFLEEWFLSNDGANFRANPDEGMPGGGWGDGTAGMNYLGASIASYQQYYNLKSTDLADETTSWQKLVDACQVLSVATNANKEATKAKLDIDKALWFLAVENIFTDDDSYVMKGKMDYMVYYEPETDRTTPLEYDGNSTFESAAATTWTPFKNATSTNYPLLNKLLNIPEWRQRYLAHYRTILNETFTTANANAIIDELNAQISTLVAADPKKLYTTAQYTSGVPALKTIVANRRTYLMSNTEVAQVAPVIASAPYYNSAMAETILLANEAANIKATVTSTSGIDKVNLYYATGLVGNFTAVQMFDDGAHNDGAASDGVFGAAIPGYAAGTFVRYYIEAIASNATLSASYLPAGAEHDIFVYTVAATQAANGVVINELLASNSAGATDEAGELEDWIELYNNNSTAVDLSGFYLTDDATNLAKWQFPVGATIAANSYMIVWADEDQDQGTLHANFKLSAAGEVVILSDAAQASVDSVTFGAQTANMGYARIPNGTGDFVSQLPTFNANNDIPLANPGISINDVVVYPNPASGVLNIGNAAILEGKPIALYNSIGQKVYEATASAEMQINTSQFAAGLYFIKSDGLTKKIIIRN
jgi:hypothetical protein